MLNGKTLITNEVTAIFSVTPFKSIPYTLHALPTEVSRFKGCWVSENKAIQAAEAVASSQSATKSDILMLEKQIILVQSEQKLMKWMLGIVLVAVVIPLIKKLVL